MHTATSRIESVRGAILLLALVFMLMLAVIAASVMQTAFFQLHMAGNDQFLEEAFNTAQAIAAELSLDQENFNLDMQVGQSNCPRGVSKFDCDVSLLPDFVGIDVPEGIALDYRVTRQEPFIYNGFPVRESQNATSSSSHFNAAIFEISVQFDGTQKKLGSAHVVRGIAVRIPSIHR